MPHIARGQATTLIRHSGVFGVACPITHDPPAILDIHRVSNGTDDSGTFRTRFTVVQACADLQLVFCNGSVNSLGNGDVVTIAGCGLEVAGVTYRVTFGGQNTRALRPGEIVVSDPIRNGAAVVSLAAADTFYARTHYTVPTGGKWPTWLFQNFGVARSEANNRGVGATDLSQGTGTTSLPTTAGEFVPAPVAVVVGQSAAPVTLPRVLALGDSITTGAGDSLTTLDLGFVVRALVAAGYPLMRLSLTGEQANHLVTASTRRVCRDLFFDGFSHAIILYGTNDLLQASRALATIQADLVTVWDRLARLGIRVWACTIPPITNAANNADAVLATGGAQTWADLNDWIRTLPSPLSGFFETADTVTSAHNTNRWGNVAWTGDGIHPTATGYGLMAAAVKPALLT